MTAKERDDTRIDMNTQWIGNVQARFKQVYGETRGAAVCGVVIPAVMGDFRKTVLKAAPGQTVTEQYRTDDRKTDVTVTGRRETRDGREVCVVEKLAVGGVSIDLGAEALVL